MNHFSFAVIFGPLRWWAWHCQVNRSPDMPERLPAFDLRSGFSGLVKSFSGPNENLAGVSIFLVALGLKRLELLHELLPAVNKIALLGNPANANFQPDVPGIRAAADALKQRLEVLTASTEGDLETVFATMVQLGIGALVVMADPFLISRRQQLVDLALRNMMPAVYPSRVFADVGGLMSCASGTLELTRQRNIYIGKILKGAKPSDLPIQQSTKTELVVNLKTAKGLIVS
jgi:putative tryptophan/tyrosine transport system substrate-binding protein